MSFGYRDEDWVEPDEVEPERCGDCPEWEPCPCGCGEGWCRARMTFTKEDDEC